MQLVAYGAQDIYLTGNPQITFFKVVYRRHTNFSMESIQQTFNGNPNFGAQVSSTISRNGDLVGRMYLQFNPDSMAMNTGNSAANIGHTLMKEIECEIGGQRIDRHYGHWLTVWNELTTPNVTRAKDAIDTEGVEPVGVTLYDLMSYNHKGVGSMSTATDGPKTATVPLQFWFNRNPGLALPLIALQYHEVKIKITFSAGAGDGGVIHSNDVTFPTQTQLWADYIYLDTDERRRFAQVSHEYLIEQLQVETGKALANATVDLNFNHPVKELIFAGQPSQTAAPTTSAATPILLGSTANGRSTETLQLKLNGHDRFTERNINYFTRTQVYQHHSGNGGVTVPDSIGVYSFALKPEEHQPSGTCNFSRIDSAQLKGTGTLASMNMYAVNYNVLRIMSGMGGLAYSN